MTATTQPTTVVMTSEPSISLTIEIWYDGLDSDDGLSDFDQDGDGSDSVYMAAMIVTILTQRPSY